MGGLTKIQKLEIVLTELIGQKVTGERIFSKLKRWKLMGFATPKALGQCLRRYRFKKDGPFYYIDNFKERRKQNNR